MPLNYATTTTANFIKDIHIAINSVYPGQPMYDCYGTGVQSQDDMGVVLKVKFNYYSAVTAAYDWNTVKSNLDYDRPVILSGHDGTTGHMWVCDGYRTYKYIFDDCSSTAESNMLHMNWGWYDGEANGWFALENFNPGIVNFNNDKTMIYNIIP